MHDPIALLRDAVAHAPRPEPRTIPVTYGRVVAFDRAGNVIGRLNIPFYQALHRFAAIIKGDRPQGFGYACLYGWLEPHERIAYTAHNGKSDMNDEAITELMAKFNAAKAPPPAPTKRTRKPRK